jgi:hypothetical protein
VELLQNGNEPLLVDRLFFRGEGFARTQLLEQGPT